MLDISWANILSSNAFNFTILVIFFAGLVKLLKLPEGIEQERQNIHQNVLESENIKKNAIEEVKSVEQSLENLPQEIETILAKAEETAKAFEEKSKEELKNLIASVETNAKKQVEAQEKQTKSVLIKNIGKSSVEIAQKQVQKAFSQNKELHNKFIEDFINNIDKLEV